MKDPQKISHYLTSQPHCDQILGWILNIQRQAEGSWHRVLAEIFLSVLFIEKIFDSLSHIFGGQELRNP